MTRCPWTGESFPPARRGGNEKKFATDAARAEAHKAARLYTEHLIETGFMSWEGSRRLGRTRLLAVNAELVKALKDAQSTLDGLSYSEGLGPDEAIMLSETCKHIDTTLQHAKENGDG